MGSISVAPLLTDLSSAGKAGGGPGGVWALGPPVVRNLLLPLRSRFRWRRVDIRRDQVCISTSTSSIVLRKDRWSGDLFVSGSHFDMEKAGEGVGVESAVVGCGTDVISDEMIRSLFLPMLV